MGGGHQVAQSGTVVGPEGEGGGGRDKGLHSQQGWCVFELLSVGEFVEHTCVDTVSGVLCIDIRGDGREEVTLVGAPDIPDRSDTGQHPRPPTAIRDAGRDRDRHH